MTRVEKLKAFRALITQLMNAEKALEKHFSSSLSNKYAIRAAKSRDEVLVKVEEAARKLFHWPIN